MQKKAAEKTSELPEEQRRERGEENKKGKTEGDVEPKPIGS